MVARKLSDLEKSLLERARARDALSPEEIISVVRVLHGLVALVAALEERPVPPRLRLLDGERP